MKIKLSEELVREVGVFELKMFGVAMNQFEWQKYADVDLREYSAEKIQRLRTLLEAALPKRPKGIVMALTDVKRWQEAMSTDAGSVKARTVEQFSTLLHILLYETEGHRVYEKSARDTWMAYFVAKVEFNPEERGSNGSRIPPSCDMEIYWKEFGVRDMRNVRFYGEDCLNMTAREALARKGFVPEKQDLRQGYLESHDRWTRVMPLIGKQYTATGIGTDDLDGNRGRSREDSWYWRSTNTINLERGGEPARVVVDVFREEDNEDDEREDYMDTYFWRRKPYAEDAKGIPPGPKKGKRRRPASETEPDEREDLPAEDEDPVDGEPAEWEVPVHPMLATFDLRRHLRLRLHIDQLTEYQYDRALGAKLIMPDDPRRLVDMLLAHRGAFKDIIKGKGAGAIVLCAGPPGTGKTLTAEVYAEVTARPLYTIQCSQLGTDPDDLEEALLKAFARAQRWNAILLLDEADVYVRRRGDDLQQNAIVGVFLRTLEYYKGVMFLTTNRADLVDDAIASRCVARITYTVPSAALLTQIWGVLAEVSGAKIGAKVIAEAVKAWPGSSGRDVKNMLKLAMMLAEDGSALTMKELQFVHRFKPTEDITDAD